MKIAILGKVHPNGLEFLKKNKLEVIEIENIESQNLIKELRFVDGILLRTAKLEEEVLQHCENLKIISRHGVGYDNVDINYLNKRKIALCITSTSNAASVAEHVLSMFIYLTKNLYLSDNLVKQGNFDKRSELPDIFELYKKKVLIIGFGRIGKEVAKRCKGFDMEVHVYDPFLDKDLIIKSNCVPIEKNEGLALSDFVSIHLPLNEKTKNFISQNELNLMKKNSVLVNTSRGEVVDERALINALKTKKIKFALLDVVKNEQFLNSKKNMLLEYAKKNSNLIISPHMAGLTFESEKKAFLISVNNIVKHFK